MSTVALALMWHQHQPSNLDDVPSRRPISSGSCGKSEGSRGMDSSWHEACRANHGHAARPDHLDVTISLHSVAVVANPKEPGHARFA